jgi:hypothetical protein
MEATQCPLCFHQYSVSGRNIPLLLVCCGSSSCSSCLENLQPTNDRRCPFCRQKIIKLASQLPKNIALMHVIEENKGPTKQPSAATDRSGPVEQVYPLSIIKERCIYRLSKGNIRSNNILIQKICHELIGKSQSDFHKIANILNQINNILNNAAFNRSGSSLHERDVMFYVNDICHYCDCDNKEVRDYARQMLLVLAQ